VINNQAYEILTESKEDAVYYYKFPTNDYVSLPQILKQDFYKNVVCALVD